MGVMLETTADVDAHSGGRRKTPGQRLNTIRAAGRQGAPTTTILLGIGEDWRDRAESLLAIREIHERHGPRPRGDRAERRPERAIGLRKARSGDDAPGRRDGAGRAPPKCRSKCRRTSRPRPTSSTAGSTTSAASPRHRRLRQPDYAWPDLDGLRTVADAGGMPLRERLPTYARFLPDGLRPSDTELPRLRPAATTRGSRRRSATGCARTTRTGDGSVASRVATARSRSVGIECERARINNCAASSFFKY